MIYFLLLLLPLSIGAVIVQQKWNKTKRIYELHKQEVRQINKIFHQALKLKYHRTPIVVATEKQEKYHNKLLRHYGNRNRKLVLIPKYLGESNATYLERKQDYINKYCDDHEEEIQYGYENFYNEVDRLKKAGLLDYLDSPFDTEQSKQFIYEFIDFLLKHPRAVYNPAVQNSTI